MVLLTICVTLSARYKLPIIREICICISNLNIYMRSFKKKLQIFKEGSPSAVAALQWALHLNTKYVFLLYS